MPIPLLTLHGKRNEHCLVEIVQPIRSRVKATFKSRRS